MGEKEVPKFISDVIDRIIKENGFRDYSLEIKSGSNVGDGFMGDISCITITERNDKKQLNLVCKMAPLNKNRRKEFVADVAFGREILFYDKLMPLFAKFQEEKQLTEDDQFRAYPKCYGTIFDEEKEQYALFLEDMRPKKFRLWNKVKTSPIDNVRLAMREIGKFHAISFAMKDQRPEEFAEFQELTDIFKHFLVSENMTKVFVACYTNAEKSLKNDQHKKIYSDFVENFVQYFDECLNEKTIGPLGVVCHGDFWNNNILYRFNDEEQDVAEDISLLDWQVIRYASPVIDLLYNIFTSTDQALRDKEYDNLLQVYYQSLSKTIKLLGSNPDELFTFDDLHNELKKYGIYALMMAPMLIQISQADSSDITNLDDMCDKMADGSLGENAALVNDLNEKAQREFERRLTGVVEDALRLGYYHKN